MEVGQAGRELAGAGARPRLVTAALVLVAVPFGVLLLLVELSWDPLRTLDDAVRDGLYRFAVATPWAVDVLRVVSALGTVVAWVLVLGALAVWLVRRGEGRAAAFVVLTPLGSVLLNTSVKALVDRARPQLPDPVAVAAHSSFPSGHAQGVVVGVGVLLVVLLPRWSPTARRVAGVLAAVWVLLMGFSRLVLGVHYLSDVLAGYVLGLACLAVSLAVLAPGARTRGG